MKIADNLAERLLNEFSSGKIEIEIFDDASILLQHPDDKEGILNYGFRIKFNGDFFATPSLLVIVNKEYQTYIDKERENFNQEINELINESHDFQITAEYLKELRLRFKQTISYYEVTQYKWHQITDDIIGHSRYMMHKNPKNRPILEEYLARTCSSFFIVQLEAIDKFLEFLDLKIDTLRILADGVSISNNRTKKKLEPIKVLDKYQSALLFHYLGQAGAKHEYSYRVLAPLISQLTGHSEKNLRTQCLNQIQQIKMGEVGNIPVLLKNKAHNLEKVRIVLRKMINDLERDLKNNRDSQKK